MFKFVSCFDLAVLLIKSHIAIKSEEIGKVAPPTCSSTKRDTAQPEVWNIICSP